MDRYRAGVAPSGIPLTVGHRGASAMAPGNTLLAISVAISYRLDYVEVDVHLSRDGQLVVHHDDDVVDALGVRTGVNTLTAAELAAIPNGTGHGVPTLAAVLALARDRIGVYVELKAPGTGQELGALVGRNPGSTALICGSFVPEYLAEVRRDAPSLPRSMLVRSTAPATIIEMSEDVAATYAHPCARPVTARMIWELHDAGFKVMTPHTNSRYEALEFWRFGADVIASDDPRVLTPLPRPARRHRWPTRRQHPVPPSSSIRGPGSTSRVRRRAGPSPHRTIA
ncbi:MAG: glycerophosphodiester phosphodiesterase [Candidatus Limnocylindria bacterium]